MTFSITPSNSSAWSMYMEIWWELNKNSCISIWMKQSLSGWGERQRKWREKYNISWKWQAVLAGISSWNTGPRRLSSMDCYTPTSLAFAKLSSTASTEKCQSVLATESRECSSWNLALPSSSTGRAQQIFPLNSSFRLGAEVGMDKLLSSPERSLNKTFF